MGTMWCSLELFCEQLVVEWIKDGLEDGMEDGAAQVFFGGISLQKLPSRVNLVPLLSGS